MNVYFIFVSLILVLVSSCNESNRIISDQIPIQVGNVEVVLGTKDRIDTLTGFISSNLNFHELNYGNETRACASTGYSYTLDYKEHTDLYSFCDSILYEFTTIFSTEGMTQFSCSVPDTIITFHRMKNGYFDNERFEIYNLTIHTEYYHSVESPHIAVVFKLK